MNFSVRSITKCIVCQRQREKTLNPAFFCGHSKRLKTHSVRTNAYNALCAVIRIQRRFERYNKIRQPDNNVVFTQSCYFLSRFESALIVYTPIVLPRPPLTRMATKPVERIVRET